MDNMPILIFLFEYFQLIAILMIAYFAYKFLLSDKNLSDITRSPFNPGKCRSILS